MAQTLTADFSELNRFAKHLRDDHAKAARAMPIIAEALVSFVQEVFEKEGAVGPHKRWADLMESTKRKRRGGPPYIILQDSGLMATNIERDAGDTYAQAYSDVPYFKWHRFERQQGRTTVPARDPFQIDEEAFLGEAEDVFLSFFRRSR